MDTLIALLLLASASGEPVLAGGPDTHPAPPCRVHIVVPEHPRAIRCGRPAETHHPEPHRPVVHPAPAPHSPAPVHREVRYGGETQYRHAPHRQDAYRDDTYRHDHHREVRRQVSERSYRTQSHARMESHVRTVTHDHAGTRRTVTLDDGFFYGGLTGGVERPASTVVYGGGRQVIIVGGSGAGGASASASAAASARASVSVQVSGGGGGHGGHGGHGH